MKNCFLCSAACIDYYYMMLVTFIARVIIAQTAGDFLRSFSFSSSLKQIPSISWLLSLSLFLCCHRFVSRRHSRFFSINSMHSGLFIISISCFLSPSLPPPPLSLSLPNTSIGPLEIIPLPHSDPRRILCIEQIHRTRKLFLLWSHNTEY